MQKITYSHIIRKLYTLQKIRCYWKTVQQNYLQLYSNIVNDSKYFIGCARIKMRILNFHKRQLQTLRNKLIQLLEKKSPTDYYLRKIICKFIWKYNVFYKVAYLLAETLKGLINRLLIG